MNKPGAARHEGVEAGASAFLPLHIEARLSYFFPSLSTRVRLKPLVFASGGIEEVDTRSSVLVVEVPCSTDYSPRCARSLNAWRRAGYGFVGAGVGLRYATPGRVALLADLRLSATFGSTSFVATPEVGATDSF